MSAKLAAAKPKAYSYTRFSTPEQSKGDSQRRQTSLAEQYAAKNGLELDDTLHMHDEGVSAFRGKNYDAQSTLSAFLKHVASGDVPSGSFLLVENLDRFSRETARKAVRVLEDIVDAKVAVVTLNDGQVYTEERLNKDQLSFVFAVLGFVRAHEESAVKSKRIKASWEGKMLKAKAKAHIPLTATCPAWLRLNKATQKFELISERAKIVRRIVRETLAGRGQNLIAADFNREGVRVFGSGKYWHTSYISKIRTNAATIGVLIPHTLEFDATNGNKRTRKPRVGGEIKGYYPAVCKPEDFKRVQLLLERDSLGRLPALADGEKKRKYKARSSLRGRHAAQGTLHNLFGAMLYCGRCGSAAILTNKGKPPKGARYVVCSKAKVGAGCKYESVRYDRIESAFMEHRSTIFGTMPASGDKGREIDKQIENLSGGITNVEDSIENLTAAVEAGGSTHATTARIREQEQHRTELTSELEALLLQRETVTPRSVKARAEELKAALSKRPIDRAHVNSLMRQVFERAVVDFDGGSLDLLWRQGGESSAVYAMPHEKRVTSKPRAKK